MAAITHVECLDFLHFQDTLKKMRIVDDTIIYALNNQLPTQSFKQECGSTCKDLYTHLEENYKTREETFERCLEYSRNRVGELKKKRNENANNVEVLKELRTEQSKMRLLETELGVEEVIKARTHKVFYDRCRQYFLPENFKI